MEFTDRPSHSNTRFIMFASKQLLKQIKLQQNGNIQLITRATICHKSDLPPRKGKRYPYERRSWGLHNFFLDPFTKRKFNENSKIIQIEGNVAAGKEDLGRRLAEQLDMYYMPHIDLEDYYINEHGYDYRALNPLLPERLRACDWEMFHENPARHSVIHMQNFLFKLRIYQYTLALRHLFNTGQGVILSRSFVTEKVFVDAMHKLGWLPMGYLRGDGVRFYDWRLRYDYIRTLVTSATMKPHLTIYLDTPVDVCLDRIKNSDDPMIANSKALIPEFLEAIKESYENDMLTRCDYFGHVLSYDYPKRATDDEILDIIDDIKPLEFNFDYKDFKFMDWNTDEAKLWHSAKRLGVSTSTGTRLMLKYYNQPTHDIAGYGDSITQVDLKLRLALFESHVGEIGKLIQYSGDEKVQGYFKAMLNLISFKQRERNVVNPDYA